MTAKYNLIQLKSGGLSNEGKHSHRITVGTSGEITVSSTAYTEWDAPEYVKIYFNPESKVIGISLREEKTDSDCFRVSYRPKQNSRRIAARSLKDYMSAGRYEYIDYEPEGYGLWIYRLEDV